MRDACGAAAILGSASACQACIAAHTTALQGFSGCNSTELQTFCDHGACKAAMEAQCSPFSEPNFTSTKCVHCAYVFDAVSLAKEGCNGSAALYTNASETVPTAFLEEICTETSCTRAINEMLVQPYCFHNGYEGGLLECNGTQRDVRCELAVIVQAIHSCSRTKECVLLNIPIPPPLSVPCVVCVLRARAAFSVLLTGPIAVTSRGLKACTAAAAAHKDDLTNAGCGNTDVAEFCRSSAPDIPPKICDGATPWPGPPIKPPHRNSSIKRIRWFSGSSESMYSNPPPLSVSCVVCVPRARAAFSVLLTRAIAVTSCGLKAWVAC